MVLKPKFVAWRPSLTLTGTSDYAVNTATGQITSHVDTWDALSDNSYLSASDMLLFTSAGVTVQGIITSLDTRHAVGQQLSLSELRAADLSQAHVKRACEGLLVQ